MRIGDLVEQRTLPLDLIDALQTDLQMLDRLIESSDEDVRLMFQTYRLNQWPAARQIMTIR